MAVGVLGSMQPHLRELLEEASVVVAVVGSPEVNVISAGEKISPEEMFDREYLVVTPGNVEEMLRKHPRLEQG